MTLINSLESYLHNESSVLFDDSDSKVCRLCIKGLPYNVGKQLLQQIIDTQGFSIYERNIPVVLFDGKNPDSLVPTSPAGGECGKDHILDLRNSTSLDEIIIILSEGTLLDMSNSTSFTDRGIAEGIAARSWIDQEVIRHIIKDAFLNKGVPLVQHTDTIENSLLDFRSSFVHDNDHEGQWILLSRLFEQDNNVSGLDQIMASCGMIHDSLGNYEFKSLSKKLVRIGESFEAVGVSTAFDEWRSRTTEDEIIQALNDFEIHVKSTCPLSSDFVTCPKYYYSPLLGSDPNSSMVADWWFKLSIDVWDELLEVTVNSSEKLHLIVKNGIFRNDKPCPVVRDEVKFEVGKGQSFEDEVTFELSVKRGKYELIESFGIEKVSPAILLVDSVPKHKSPVFYQVAVQGAQTHKEGKAKLICLETYEPGIAFGFIQAIKVKALSKIKSRSKKLVGWESNVVLANSGIHEFEFATNDYTEVLSAQRYEEGADKLPSDSRDLDITTIEGGGLISLNIEDDLFIELTISNKTDQYIVKVAVSIAESEPIGVDSVLKKYIVQNLSKKGLKETVQVYYNSSSVLDQFQKWICEEHINSWYPLLLGVDFKDVLKKPNWAKAPVITNSRMVIDFRPTITEISPPEKLVKLRSEIIDFITKGEDDGENSDVLHPIMEYCELYSGNKSRNIDEVLLNEYLTTYNSWQKEDSEMSRWFDVIAICDSNNGVLNSEPSCILQSPFHPVRLMWLYLAQKSLYEALENNLPCPAAGVLDPSSVVDSITLACKQRQSSKSYQSYFSVGNSSDAWGVLWNVEDLKSLANSPLLEIFDSSFGLQLEGLESGLSSSQIEHSLDDMVRIKSAKSGFNVSIYSDSNETSLLNSGIFSWCSKNLGDDITDSSNRKLVRDLWFSSGARNLSVHDTRPQKFHPSPELLAEHTRDSDYQIKWYGVDTNSSQGDFDLSIISHLNSVSPLSLSSPNKSVLIEGGLFRARIRFCSIESESQISFTESRTSKGSYSGEDKKMDDLNDALFHIENEVFERGKGALNTTPNLSHVEQHLLTSDYCAVASSVVDPSAFFSSDGDSYLWDYDLPSYANKSTGNSGFYLLARSSDAVRDSVKNSLRNLPGCESVSEEVVVSILNEISGRGIPTLKTMAIGGANASGEIGMLVGMRLLQSFEERDQSSNELLPINVGTINNLIISVDPFRSQLDYLCEHLNLDKIRPDLLVLSFQFEGGSFRAKFSCVEIKYRSSVMSRRDMVSALSQCENLIKLLEKLGDLSQDYPIWNVARIKLLTDLTNFAFATYGRQIKEVREVRDWAILREEVIRSFSERGQYQLNPEGRLLIVSDYKLSNPETIKHKNDCLQISFKDATDLILNPKSKDLSGFRTAVEDWGLSLPPLTDIQVETKVLPIIEITEEADQPDNNETVSQPKITKGKDPEIENDVINEEDLGNGIYFPIGEQKGAIKSVTNYFHPSNTNLNQLNIGVVGDLGTGKTQLIKALIYNISKDEAQNRGKSPKFFIMDTKRDYDGTGDKDSDKKFVIDIKAKVVKPNILPINLFDIRNSTDDDPAYTKADFFIDILKKIFGGIGPKQEDGLLEAVMNCFEARGYEAFEGDYSDFVSPTLKDVFEEYKESIGDKKDAPYSLMNKLIRARLFEEDSAKTIGFSEFFDQTVVLSLGGIASNDRNLKMVMIIFMNLFREYMLNVKKSPFIKRDGFQLRQIDSYLLIDEANLIMEYELPVLEDLLLKGREFGVGILLSSQYMSHFKKSGTNYMEPLLTWFVHKVPNITIRELSALGLSNVDDQMVNKIKNLECHYCLYKSLNAPGNFVEGIPYYKLLAIDS